MVEITGVPHKKAIPCPGVVLQPRRAPLVMGVLNVTPDSFSDGDTYVEAEVACARALQMAAEGADIIDIGGESTRPGSAGTAVRTELERVLPVIEKLRGQLNAPLSIDTRHAVVASAAIEAGCRIINDVSACRDPEMPDVARETGAAIIVMHMKGEPASMQKSPHYTDTVAEITQFLASRVALLRDRGVDASRIVVDPGIGFGKRLRDNLEVLESLESFRALGHPVLVGASRKSFLGRLLDAEPGDRLSGSLAVAARCYAAEVDIIRVHDVKETVGLFKVLDAMAWPADPKHGS